MSSYSNFQSDNAKYSTKEGRNNYNADLNNSVKTKGKNEHNKLKSNLDKYIEFLSWAR